MPPRNFNLILFAVVISILCHFTYRSTRTASILGEAIELIEQNYVDPIDQQKLVMAAMQGMVSQLDEHSSYFTVDAYESFQDSMHQEFAGIGIYVDQPEPGAPVRVVTPLVDSPALHAGVLPNDRIIQVDGQDVSKMLLPEVSKRLKGIPGTKVSLKVRRGEESEETALIVIERKTIELKSVVGDHRDADHHWVYRLASQPSVAYVRLKSFGEKTVDELEKVLKHLDNDFAALVVDLRGNGGGLLYAARDVSDMFLSRGQIVSTRSRDGRIEESYAATLGTLVDHDKPIAILIDENSASASEIVAACLQDNHRAIVVGMRSFGKGTVQEIIPLQYGRSALRLTVARYYRPNNKNIHRSIDAGDDDEWGVTPEEGFVIPMDDSALRKLGLRWRAASFPLLAGIELSGVGTEQEQPPEEQLSEEQPSERPSRPLDQDVDRSPPAEIEGLAPAVLSEVAKQNIARGPEGLADDPPLRAAVGELLNPQDSAPQTESAPKSQQNDGGDEKRKKAA